MTAQCYTTLRAFKSIVAKCLEVAGLRTDLSDDYRILPGKRPWTLAVQRRKLGGGRLRELPGAYQGTFMR